DASTDINLSTLDLFVDLTDSGVFSVRDVTTAYWTFDDDSTVDVLFPAAGTIGIDASTTANTTTTGVINLDVTSLTNNNSALNIAYTHTATGATTGYGVVNTWASTAVVTGAAVSQTAYGYYSTLSKTGADTATGTYTAYGLYQTATNTGRTDAGTVTTIGAYLDATGDASGTASAFGLYLADVSGADTNVALCFDCDGTWSASTVASGIQFGTDANAVSLYRSASDVLRTGDGLTVDLDLIVTGGDITGANSAAIDLGEATAGSITFTAGTTGDFVFTLDADTNAQFTATSPAVDTVAISGGTSTTDGVDALQLTFTGSNASGNIIDITPSISVNASDTFNVIDVDAFTGTISAAGALTLNALAVGNLTQSETTGTITATALNLGTGWDNLLVYNGTAVINGTGQVVAGQITGTLLTLSGDTGTDEALAQGNTLEVAGGTNGIDTVISATDTVTLNLDTTEIGTTTFGSGSSIIWTFNSGTTDPVITFGDNALTIGTAATITATDVTAFNCTDCLNFDDISDSPTLDASTDINLSTLDLFVDLT
ncbi:MAG: hypothetical protein AAB606_05790, partial [Patescibacteria group bacterium]